jgi:uncharacterized Zn finger protein (UPF0148 family)
MTGVGNKMHCPGCGSWTSDLLRAYQEDMPCPHCGLSAEAIAEITEVRQRVADEELKKRYEETLVKLGRAETELAKARYRLSRVREALDSDE